MKDSFIFYRSFYDSLKEIPDDEQIKVYKAISEYALNNNELELTGVAKAIFLLIKPQIDANNRKYENGKKGGAPKGNKNAQKNNQETTKKQPKNNLKTTEQQPNVNDNVNVNVNDNVNDIYIHFANAEFVSMTNVEYEKLVNTYGKEFADQCITVLDNYKGSSGKKYKSDYRAILNWVIDKVKKDKENKNIVNKKDKAHSYEYCKSTFDDLEGLYDN